MRGRIEIIDTAPTGDALLDDALASMTGGRRGRPAAIRRSLQRLNHRIAGGPAAPAAGHAGQGVVEQRVTSRRGIDDLDPAAHDVDAARCGEPDEFQPGQAEAQFGTNGQPAVGARGKQQEVIPKLVHVPTITARGRPGTPRRYGVFSMPRGPPAPPSAGAMIPAGPARFNREPTRRKEPSVTEMKSGTLNVPGAVLHYDVRNSETTTEPVLLMIGSPMGAAGFVTLAGHFSDRTVVTYDPRSSGRSKRTDGAMVTTPPEHADDLHRLIGALGAGPVDIFASSGGAVNALALAAGHPEQVRTLVAHEPPAFSELPDVRRSSPSARTSARRTSDAATARRWRSSSRSSWSRDRCPPTT